MHFTLNFNQKLKDLEGRPIRLGLGLLAQPIAAAITRCTAGLPQEVQEPLGKALDECFGKEQTLASVAMDSLLTGHEDEKNLGGEEKVRRFELARRIGKAKGEVEVNFNTTERDLIKMLVNKTYSGPLVYSLVHELLEGAPKFDEPTTA